MEDHLFYVPKYYPPTSGRKEFSLFRTLLYDECFAIKHLYAAIRFPCVVHLSLRVGTTFFFSFGMLNSQKIPDTELYLN